MACDPNIDLFTNGQRTPRTDSQRKLDKEEIQHALLLSSPTIALPSLSLGAVPEEQGAMAGGRRILGTGESLA